MKLTGRQRSSAFREYLINQRLLASSVEASELRLIRLGLGMPCVAPLRPHWGKRLGFMLMSMALPERNAVGLTVMAIRATRTEEGKKYLYSQFLRHLVIGGSDLRRYDDALRLVLTKVDSLRSFKQITQLVAYGEHLLAAGLGLGKRDADGLIAALTPLHRRIGEREVRVLVEEQVIEHDFACLTPYLEASTYQSCSSPTDAEPLRATIHRLKRAGVPPARLLRLVGEKHFSPDQLETLLDILVRHGISDIATVFERMGTRLWSIETGALAYVLGVVGVADAETFSRFTDLLEEYRAPAPGVAKALIANGATPAELAQCQRFLIESGKMHNPVLARIDVLMARPFALTFADLDGCSAYLRQDFSSTDRFKDFLGVLAAHQLDGKEAILAFAPRFDSIGEIASVDLRLAILRKHFQAMPLARAVAWIEASRCAYDRSLSYLGLDVSLALSNESDLAKLADLAKVSLCLLRYLVKERGLRTLTRLHDWYYLEGSGVGSYHGGDDYDETELLLFRNCSKRGSFYRLKDNAYALVSAVSDWVDGRLRAPAPDCEQAVRQRYWAVRASFTRAGRYAAARHIDQILESTDGILLESVLLDGLRGANVGTVLQKFVPLTATLLLGQGPTSASLGPFEAECIRLVYGASPNRIRELWGQVRGFETHLCGLNLSNTFPFRPRLQTASLEGASRAIYDGIASAVSALALAAQAASREDQSATDLLLAAPWRHVGNNAATLADLGPWLAFMLKAGSSSGEVAKWIDQKLAGMQSILLAPEKAAVIEREFSQFITTTLPDALAEALPAYLAGKEFTARLDELVVIAAKRKQGGDGLPETVKAMVAQVLKVAGRTLRQLRRAMTKSVVDEEFRGHAVVSKHPAAFFAKDAFELCSKDDTSMWGETRHSHLLMFDPNGKRLVGMAMLYVQPIPGYADTKKCLVIRAVNVGTVGLRRFDPLSVLDEVRRIAIEIARANQLEAVLFPEGSTHFSNQDDIVKALSKSSLKKSARPLTLRNGVFYCREMGRSSDAVKELQLAWVRAGNEDTQEPESAKTVSESDMSPPH